MKIFIFLFFFFSFSLSLDFSPYNEKNSTCEERLIDRSKTLTDEHYKELCNILTAYPLFMIRLRNEIEYAIHGAVFFEAA